jgi:segregation and condensation protein A
MQSFGALMARLAEDEADRPEQQIEREAYTVQQQLFRIQGILGERRGPVGFREFFSCRPSRAEVVTVFIALLELIKLGRIALRQESLFGGITIEAHARREEDTEHGEA